jgi:hypothetical protein
MEQKIMEHLNDPEVLERLYRADTKGFRLAFLSLYPAVSTHPMAPFWKARLDADSESLPANFVAPGDILALVLASLIGGILIKLPDLFGFSKEITMFYERYAALIVFFGLTLYTVLTKEIRNTKQIVFIALVFLVSAFYVNLLPVGSESHSTNLAYIHLPLMFWCLYGLVFVDFDLRTKAKRIGYIRHNGDLAVLGAVVLIAGGMLTGITLGLFSAIEVDIEKVYIEYIVVWGLVSSPIVVSFILRKYPFISSRIAPVIARVFSPLVLLTLIVYLGSIIASGKDPYNDREFLLVFNLLLLGVMAIIIFSIPETSLGRRQRFNEFILLGLTLLTLIINIVALSAIFYRLGEFGFSPNRTVVLGSNLLIFGNMLLIMIDLTRVVFGNKEIRQVENTIAAYAPLYVGWTVFVVFILPWIFGLR